MEHGFKYQADINPVFETVLIKLSIEKGEVKEANFNGEEQSDDDLFEMEEEELIEMEDDVFSHAIDETFAFYEDEFILPFPIPV